MKIKFTLLKHWWCKNVITKNIAIKIHHQVYFYERWTNVSGDFPSLAQLLPLQSIVILSVLRRGLTTLLRVLGELKSRHCVTKNNFRGIDSFERFFGFFVCKPQRRVLNSMSMSNHFCYLFVCIEAFPNHKLTS